MYLAALELPASRTNIRPGTTLAIEESVDERFVRGIDMNVNPFVKEVRNIVFDVT